jgi:hypothetical protein
MFPGIENSASIIFFLIIVKCFVSLSMTKELIVIYPIPPSCIRMRITICPKRLYDLDTSTVDKPVVEIAEVAVNT